MSPPRMVGEDETGFTLHDGSSPFRVPKRDLSPTLEARIRAMGAGAAETAAQTATYAPDVAAPPDAGNSLTAGPPVVIPQPVELSRPPPVAPLPLGASPAERPFNPDEIPRDSTPNLAADFGRQRKQDAERRLGMPLGENWEQQIASPRASEGYGLGDQGRALGISPAGVAGAAVVGAAGQAPPPVPQPRRGGGSSPPSGAADINAGFALQKRGAEDLADVASAQGEAEAKRLAAQQRQMEIQAADDQDFHAKAAARSADQMSKWEAASNEMKNISTTVDPGRFWASKDTTGKIAGIIGLVLGAFGTSPDGVNRAAVMLNNAVDRDIDAQKAEFAARMAKGRAAVDSASSLYAMNRQIFGDELAARAGAKASALALAENEVQKNLAAAKGPAAQAQLQAILGQIQQKKGESLNEMKAAADNKALQWAAFNAKAAPAIGQASATALTEIENRNQNIHNSGKKLLDLIDAYGTSETYTPGIEGQMGQLVTDMAVDAAKLKDPTSVARPGEVELELSNLFKPGMWQRDASAKAKIQAFLDNAQNRRAVAYQVRGLPSPGAK